MNIKKDKFFSRKTFIGTLYVGNFDTMCYIIRTLFQYFLLPTFVFEIQKSKTLHYIKGCTLENGL